MEYCVNQSSETLLKIATRQIVLEDRVQIHRLEGNSVCMVREGA